jgi:hypothetical protein
MAVHGRALEAADFEAGCSRGAAREGLSVRKQELTEELCSRLRPLRRKAVADTACRGLVARFGRSGVSFHIWAQGDPDPTTGKRKRKFIGLGTWSEHGGIRTLTLAQARQRAHDARAREAGMLGEGTTVEQIATSYRRNILFRQERADETWAILEQHVLDRSPAPGQLRSGSGCRQRWSSVTSSS